jgi:hypothetical protein
VFRRFVPAIGVASAVAVAAISLGPTLGQTNIDQGKPASELFANYCAVCHKSTRGLANGRNSLTLSLFLREHYAASSQQAAALAAYVISAGGSAPAAKPEQRARPEEPKGQEAKGHEAKPRAASASPKSEPEKPGRAGEPGHAIEPSHEEGSPAQEEPAPVLAAPVTTGSPASPPPKSGEVPELRPTTSAGVESQSNDGAPVPRDNIPD